MVLYHDLLYRDGERMTLIALQGGKVVMYGDKVGTEQECCCGAEGCGECAESCSATVSVRVEWCGMEVEFSLPIPGSVGFTEDPDPPDAESYLTVSASIACGTCGWILEITVCANCAATNQFASDGFTAFIPFASTQEAGGGYCPQSGTVELECFGEQFGIPCKTTATATI